MGTLTDSCSCNTKSCQKWAYFCKNNKNTEKSECNRPLIVGKKNQTKEVWNIEISIPDYGNYQDPSTEILLPISSNYTGIDLSGVDLSGAELGNLILEGSYMDIYNCPKILPRGMVCEPQTAFNAHRNIMYVPGCTDFESSASNKIQNDLTNLQAVGVKNNPNKVYEKEFLSYAPWSFENLAWPYDILNHENLIVNKSYLEMPWKMYNTDGICIVQNMTGSNNMSGVIEYTGKGRETKYLCETRQPGMWIGGGYCSNYDIKTKPCVQNGFLWTDAKGHCSEHHFETEYECASTPGTWKYHRRNCRNNFKS